LVPKLQSAGGHTMKIARIGLATLLALAAPRALGAEWKVPARAAAAINPVPSTERSLERGRRIWARECVDCHGDKGKGDGPGAARLDQGVPDLREPAIAAQSDGALFFKVKAGRRPMPGYREMLGDEDLWHVVNHMRRLIGRPTPVRRPAPIIQAAATATVAPAVEAKLEVATSTPAIETRTPTAAPAATVATLDTTALEELDKKIDAVEGTLEPGDYKLLIAGTASAFFSRIGEENNFGAVLSPHLFWKLGDELLVESHVDLRLDPEHGTEVNLEFAHIAYAINRWLILGAGKLVTPFGLFQDRIHTSWVNRLPNEPLLTRHHDGLIPKHDLGVTLRGVLDVIVADNHHVTTLDYASYLSRDSLGGRVGWRILPELELGGSASWNRTEDTTITGADLHFVSPVAPLQGTVLIEAEYARVDARRQGFYALLSYSPSQILRALEIVARYDYLDPRRGVTAGINYWLASTVVLKTAYSWTRISGVEEPTREILVQAAVGL
jgi:mono/diheme cytochrome c family protein